MPIRKEVTTIINPGKISKVFSNNLKMSCKTFCCECDKAVTLSGMTKHVKTWHQMTLTAYKDLYGNPRKQIIQVVYHKCALCKSSILSDTTDMSKHLKKNHQISYKEYSARLMAMIQPISQASQMKATVKKEEVLSVDNTTGSSLVVIRCDQCPRTFKQNIQLKIHKRKHSTII